MELRSLTLDSSHFRGTVRVGGPRAPQCVAGKQVAPASVGCARQLIWVVSMILPPAFLRHRQGGQGAMNVLVY